MDLIKTIRIITSHITQGIKCACKQLDPNMTISRTGQQPSYSININTAIDSLDVHEN